MTCKCLKNNGGEKQILIYKSSIKTGYACQSTRCGNRPSDFIVSYQQRPRMNIVLTLIDWIERHPVTGAAILAVSGVVLLGTWRYFYSKKNVSPYISPVFYSLGKNYFVTAVQEYIPSNDESGYKQIQHSRPDQWSKFINIDSSLFGLRYKVVPLDPSAHLAVVVRPTRKGKEKLILFNR